MSISSHELIQLLSATSPGAAPQERRHVQTSIDLIDRSNVIARLDSEASLFLRQTYERGGDFFQPAMVARLTEADIYGVDVPLVNAFARVQEGRNQLIVFNGVQQVILFYAHLVTVLSLLQSLRPDRTITVNAHEETEAAAFSLAGFSILADFMVSGRTLAAVGDVLGPVAYRNAQIGYAGAMAFILAHEIGHLALGHTRVRGVVSERNSVPLAIAESVNLRQIHEFEADAYAISGLKEHLRAHFISSVLFFFGPMAFLEAFARPTASTHPLFTNRAAHVASLISADAETEAIIASIIEGQISGFKTVSAMRDEQGGDIRSRIHETMPVAEAYDIIRRIKERVQMEMGQLETANP